MGEVGLGEVGLGDWCAKEGKVLSVGSVLLPSANVSPLISSILYF